MDIEALNILIELTKEEIDDLNSSLKDAEKKLTRYEIQKQEIINELNRANGTTTV